MGFGLGPDAIGLGQVLCRSEHGERQHQPADDIARTRPDHDQGDGHDAAVDDQVADRDVRTLHPGQAVQPGPSHRGQGDLGQHQGGHGEGRVSRLAW